MQQRSWNAVFVLIWRKISGVGLVTIYFRDKKGPQLPLLSQHPISAPCAPPPAAFSAHLISGLHLPTAVVSFQSSPDPGLSAALGTVNCSFRSKQFLLFPFLTLPSP